MRVRQLLAALTLKLLVGRAERKFLRLFSNWSKSAGFSMIVGKPKQEKPAVAVSRQVKAEKAMGQMLNRLPAPKPKKK
jgi:hypothetical protein